jgi:hypothetical protein
MVLDGGECSSSCPNLFTPGEGGPDTNWLAPETVWKFWGGEKFVACVGSCRSYPVSVVIDIYTVKPA